MNKGSNMITRNRMSELCGSGDERWMVAYPLSNDYARTIAIHIHKHDAW
jgi:hypothetical protein